MINLEIITPSELESQLYSLAHKCFESDKAYIQADEDFQILEDARKPFLAVLMEGMDVKTTAEKERLAYASMDYVQWQQGYQNARNKARQLRVERDNYIRLWETCRSLLSSRNQSKRTGV